MNQTALEFFKDLLSKPTPSGYEQPGQKVVTEYKFLEQLLLRATQDSRGHYGGELSYRLEFR